MPEPLTAAGLVALAFVQQAMQSELGKKFIEGTIGKLAEKLTESGLKKASELRQIIANRLKGKSKNADAALVAAAQGSGMGLEEVAKQLQAEMDQDPKFATVLKQVAAEIHQDIAIAQMQRQRAVQIYDQILGSNHPDTENAYSWLREIQQAVDATAS